MERLGEPVVLIENHHKEYGYERTGEDHHYDPNGSHIVQLLKAQMAQNLGCSPDAITDITPAIESTPEQYRPLLKVLRPCQSLRARCRCGAQSRD